MTFRGWLRGQAGRRDAIGDLARDMIADGRCWTGRSPASLIDHITVEHGGWEPAVRTARRARIIWQRCPPGVEPT